MEAWLLPPELWEHPELRTAVESGDFAALVRASGKRARQFQTAIASHCALSHPYISAIESGRRFAASAAVRARVLDGHGVRRICALVRQTRIWQRRALHRTKPRRLSSPSARPLRMSAARPSTLGVFEDLAFEYSRTGPVVQIGRLRTHLAYVSQLMGGHKTLAEQRFVTCCSKGHRRDLSLALARVSAFRSVAFSRGDMVRAYASP